MPIKNFFADEQPEEKPSAASAEKDMQDDDIFASMQSIDLFEENGQDAAADFAALSQMPDPQPAPLPAAQPAPAPAPEKANVGQAVFDHLFADDLPAAADDFAPLPLFDEPAPQNAVVPEPAAPVHTDDIPDVPSFMQRPAEPVRPKPMLFDYDATETPSASGAGDMFAFEEPSGKDSFQEPSSSAGGQAAPLPSYNGQSHRQYKPVFPAGFTKNFMKPEPAPVKTAAEIAAELDAQKQAEEQARQAALLAEQQVQAAVQPQQMPAQPAPAVEASIPAPAPVQPVPVPAQPSPAEPFAAAQPFFDDVPAAPQTPAAPADSNDKSSFAADFAALPFFDDVPAAPQTPAQPAAPAGSNDKNSFAADFAALPLFDDVPAPSGLDTPDKTPAAAAPQDEFAVAFGDLPQFDAPQPAAEKADSAPFASNLQALLMGEDAPAPQPAAQAPTAHYVDDAPTREIPAGGFKAVPKQPEPTDGFESLGFEDDAAPSQPDLFASDFSSLSDDAFALPEEPSAPVPSAEKAPEAAFNPFESAEWQDEFEPDDGDDFLEDNGANDGRPPRRTPRPKGKKPSGGGNLPLILLLVVLVVAIIGVGWYALFGGKEKKPAASSSSATSSVTTSQPAAPSESVSSEPQVVVQPIPRDEWYLKLVNKDNVLSADYAVTTGKSVDGVEVDSRIVDALNQMIADAKAQGINLKTVAGYRSYARQKASYEAGTSAAAPGTSEHNLGLSVDIQSTTSYDYADTFKDSAEAAWLRENAANYGFIERYPDGSKELTGFDPEPWHYRYVGVDQAQKIKASGLVLEQYLAQDIPTGVPAA